MSWPQSFGTNTQSVRILFIQCPVHSTGGVLGGFLAFCAHSTTEAQQPTLSCFPHHCPHLC